ncbi:hypothetical protein [Arthrobacter psychrolactophilus]
MNDPNGLIYDGGLWHVYFQYNPESPHWGNMSWRPRHQHRFAALDGAPRGAAAPPAIRADGFSGSRS